MMSKGKTAQTVKGKALEEFTEIPKVGEVWTDIEKSGDKVTRWNWYFVGAFTGKASDILDKSRNYGQTYSYHTIKGKKYTFLWADIGDHESMPADYEEITIKIPASAYEKYLKRCQDVGQNDVSKQASKDLADLAKSW